MVIGDSIDPERAGDQPITIGLVNNMPGGAFDATETQFRSLLTLASRGLSIRLMLYSLPVYRPGGLAGQPVDGYRDLADLGTDGVDGLIVTGTEPQAIAMTQEPSWAALIRIVEWAEQNTISTIWSCLAAHAAVLHLDGIERRRLHKKLFGVFECEKGTDHRLLNGLPASWHVPHSRWNDLPEEALVRHGYSIVSRSPRAGADIFMRAGSSLFLFVQGHPEYTPDALFREYRRDVRRFVCGESGHYPELPDNYFDIDTDGRLRELQERALDRDPAVVSDMPASAHVQPIRSWQQPAVAIYANWLRYVAEQKLLRQSCSAVAAQPQLV